MVYKFFITTEIQKQILDLYGPETRKILRRFLLLIAENPRPACAVEFAPDAYYAQTKNRLYIGWTIEPRTTSDDAKDDYQTIRVLGIGHTPSAATDERLRR